jgi:hypothetical protein
MKSTTPQTVFARSGDRAGAFAVASEQTQAKDQPKALRTQLVFRDDSGAIAQSWPLQQAKCTLGSSQRCEVQVELSGIEPLNALIVLGVRQAFVRALVPNLSRDGVFVNELLLTEQQNYFELAGHRFEVQREPRKLNAKTPSSSRIRFSTSRPFDLSSPPVASRYARASERELPTELADSPWLKSLIERTFEPLEAQLESLLLPMTEFQTKVLESQQAREAESVADKQKQVELAQELSAVVAKQSATMESLGERLRDVNQQLSTIERMIAEDEQLESRAKDSIAEEVSVQRTAIEQLQTGMVAVTESLNQLHDRQQAEQSEQSLWKESVCEQLNELAQGVGELKDISNQRPDSNVLDAVQSLQQNQQLLQEELQRWQYGLHEHLENLEKQVSQLSDIANSIQRSPEVASERLDSADSPSDRLPVVDPTDQDPFIHDPSTGPSRDSSTGGPSTARSELIRKSDDSEVFPTWEGETDEETETDGTSRSSPSADGYHGTSSSVLERAESNDWLDQWTAVPTESAVSGTPWSYEDQAKSAAVEPWDMSEQLPEASSIEDTDQPGSDPDSTDWSISGQAYSSSPTSDASLLPSSEPLPGKTESPLVRADESEFFFGAESLPAQPRSDHRSDSAPRFDQASFQVEENSALDRAESVSAPLPSWWMEDGDEEPTETDSNHESLLQGHAIQDRASAEPVQEAEPIDSYRPATEPAVEEPAVEEPAAEEPAEQSVEDYMNSLLARMRGEAPPAKGAPSQVNTTKSSAAQSSPAQHSLPALTNSHSLNDAVGSQHEDPPAALEALDLDNYVSLTKAPEKSKNINAMRELANSSARQAVHKSTRKRYISSSLLKLAICMIGLTVAGVLFAVNGFALNVGLIATLASLLVAAIWGYDGIMGLKPLLQSSLVLAPPHVAELADGDE